MATAQEVAVRRELLRQLEQDGYNTLITQWPQKMTWFKTVRHEDGSTDEVAMRNLPADAWHMEKFMKAGFRPDLQRNEPPAVVDRTAAIPAHDDEMAYLAEVPPPAIAEVASNLVDEKPIRPTRAKGRGDAQRGD